MLPVHQQAMRFRETVNIHPKAGRQPFGILFFEIHEAGLFAAGTAFFAGKRMLDGG